MLYANDNTYLIVKITLRDTALEPSRTGQTQTRLLEHDIKGELSPLIWYE